MQTLLTCYQHADEETMLRVMATPVNWSAGGGCSKGEKR
jgi:hypothetical protein